MWIWYSEATPRRPVQCKGEALYIDDVKDLVFVYRGDSTSADVGAEFFLNSHAEAY